MNTPPTADEGITHLVGRMVDDARSVVGAEVELYKARAAAKLTAYRNAAIFFAAAGLLALAALIALLVGLILTLATLLGPGWATLIVVGAVLALAGVLALIGRRKLATPPAGDAGA